MYSFVILISLKSLIDMAAIIISNKIIGDTVYSTGYSLFPRECNPSPSLSKGCISQVNPSMIKTTCCVQPGSSGGAILDHEGALLGIIVCNAKLENNNMVYPRINMAVPFSAIFETICSFIKTDGMRGSDFSNCLETFFTAPVCSCRYYCKLKLSRGLETKAMEYVQINFPKFSTTFDSLTR